MAVAKAVSILRKVVEALVVPAQRQFSYLFCYKHNIEEMAGIAKSLKDHKDEVQQLIDVAYSNMEVIAPDVAVWLNEVDAWMESRILEAEAFGDKGCLYGRCPNPKSRYSLGRKAFRVAQTMVKFLKDGDFRRISYPPLPPGVVPAPSTSTIGGSKGFPSGKIIAQEIAGALKQDTIAVIGIYGMEGDGKTTMVEEIIQRAQFERDFDEIAIASVSQNIDVIKIQGRLATVLGLNLPDKTNIPARVQCLRERLANGRRILLILDDVWEVLDMRAMGIPIGDGCKVVFLSQNEDVCDKMGNRTLRIRLSYAEAWDLFKKIAGECVDSPDLYLIAREVVQKCEGLPLHIVTWGRKLKTKKKNAWVDALQELREAYSPIESIYDDLEKVEAKSLFRLCCQFPKDEEIQIELLIRYSVGLQLIEGKKTLVEAREGVDLLVKELINRELLVAGSEGFVKVPDAEWDARRDKFSARKERNEYLLLRDNGLMESSENDEFDPYTTISINSNEMHELPDYIDCTGLKLLSFECNHDELEMSRDIFEGMKDLQVIDFRINIREPLPPSLKFLRNLRTLYLDFCSLGDISLIGGLRELKILSFFRSEIGELPREIRKLKKLKLLDLRCKRGPSIIKDGVLSELKELEELYTGNYFDPRNVVEENKGKGAKAAELSSLSRLKALQISITLKNDFLQKFEKFKFKNLKGFDFSLFDVESLLFPQYHLSNSVAFYGVRMPKVSANVNELLRKAEGLSLEVVKDSTNLGIIKLVKEAYLNLKRLNMSKCRQVQYVFDAEVLSDPDNVIFGRLEEMTLMGLPEMRQLWKGQIQLPCLSNLRVLKMQDCDSITSLFPSSAINCLVQLEELTVTKCKSLKAVVSKEAVEVKEDTEKIEFPKLKILSLSQLPEYRSFSPETEPNFYRSSNDIADAREHLFNKQVSLANLEKLDIGNLYIHALILGDQIQAWSLSNLQVLRVFSCIPLEAVFDFEGLQLGGDLLEEVMFNRLETMDLYDLPSLRRLWRKIPTGIQGFHNLRTLQVSTCECLTFLLSISMAKMLVSLEDLTIRNCEIMREVIGTEEEEGSSTAEMTDTIVFPKLRFLALKDLKSLQMFCHTKHDVELPLMEKIFITNCPSMKTFCSGHVTAPELKRMDIKSRDLDDWVWKGDLNKTIAFLGEKGLKMDKRASH